MDLPRPLPGAPFTGQAASLLTALAWVAWRQDDKITARLASGKHWPSPRSTPRRTFHVGINNGSDPLGLDIV